MRLNTAHYISLLIFLFFSATTVSLGQCPNNLTVEVSDCGEIQASLNEFGEVGNIIWYWGDDTQSSGANFVSHQYEESGTYSVCVAAWTGECEQGVELCQEVEIEVCGNPCDLDVEVVQDGDVLYFTPSNYPDNADIFWTVNTEGFGSGEEFTYELSEPGAYQICASYETPECPQGVFWCESFFMEAENDCPDEEDFYADNVASSCTSWVFEIGSFVEGEEVFWEYGDGTWEWGGHFTDHQYQEEGEYEVCAYYHSPLCPDTVILCQTILVECEENPCDLDVEVVQDGDVLYFTPSNYPDNANIFWTVNTEGFGSGEEFTYELSEPGAYQICASYETPECPQGVFWCESFFVEAENDCPGAEDFYADHVASSCTSWVFEIGSFVEGEEVYWEYGDGTWEWGGHFTDHQYQEEGEYEVCAHYHSPLCPDTVILCQTIIVECEENPCELDVEYEVDGDTLLLYAFNFPENANIWWSVNDGDPIGPGDAYSISIADPGTYEVCAFYETPECPQGVFWCETWTVEGDNCPTGLIYEELECGLYEFTIEGGNDDADVFWNFGNQAYQSDGSPHTHFFEEGVYTVYIIYLDENCQAENYIVELEVPDCGDPECTWFEFEVATNADLLPVELDWSMTSQEGFTAGGGSVSLSGDVVTFNGEVCLMPGCYTLTLSSDFPIGLSDFDFDFPTIPGIPLSIDWIQDDNPFTLHSQIDLAGNCDWSVGLDENALEAVVIYPVPASNHLNIQIPEDTPTEVRLFDATGKVVKQQTIYQSEQISVAEFSSGYYILQLQQGTDFKTFSVPLLN